MDTNKSAAPVNARAVSREIAQIIDSTLCYMGNSHSSRVHWYQILQKKIEFFALKNYVPQEALGGLSTPHLVDFFEAIAHSKSTKLRKSHLLSQIQDEADERIGLAYDKNWQVSDKEAKALLKYARIAPYLLKLTKDYETILYTDAIKHLQRERDLRANQVLLFATLPDAVKTPPEKVRDKSYAKDVLKKFSSVAPSYGIRLKRTDTETDDFVCLELYPWMQHEDDKPNGYFMVRHSSKYTLVSAEKKHCAALVAVMKQLGKKEVLLRRQNSDPEVAKKFAADFVAACNAEELHVNHPYAISELTPYNPQAGTFRTFLSVKLKDKKNATK